MFLDIRWFEGEQVPGAIKNTEELRESGEEMIDDSDDDQSDYQNY